MNDLKTTKHPLNYCIIVSVQALTRTDDVYKTKNRRKRRNRGESALTKQGERIGGGWKGAKEKIDEE